MQIAEITQQETAERAALLRVDTYDVQLDLTRGGELFRSVSLIRFRCTEPGRGQLRRPDRRGACTRSP